MDGKKIIARYDELRSERRCYEDAWEEEARLFSPGRRGMTNDSEKTPRQVQGIYSSDPIMAANALHSELYGTLTNQANQWMTLAIADTDLMEAPNVREWLGVVSSRVLNSFRPSVSSFYPKTIQTFRDVVIHGNACSYDELNEDRKKIVDLAIPLGEVVVARDAFDELSEVIRRYRLSADKAASHFGYDALPKKLQECVDKSKAEKFLFYHHVVKNDDWRPGYIGPKGKEFSSKYVCEVDCKIVKSGGYDEMPFTYPGWDRESGETYARGAAYIATPSARTLNLMEGANLELGQRSARPTILAPDRRSINYGMKPNPGTILYGAMVGGRAQIQPFLPTQGTGLSLEMTERKINQVKDAFLYNLLQLVGRTGMTATEVVEIQSQKLRLMAPHLGNQQTEYLVPKVQRRFAMLWRAGQIPPPPPEISGQPLDVQYLSAAAMAAKSAEGAAIVRLFDDLAPLAAISPEHVQRAVDRLDPDGLVESLSDARGVPSRVLRSRDVADEIAASRAQQQQQQEAIAIAGQAASIGADLSQIEAANAVPA